MKNGTIISAKRSVKEKPASKAEQASRGSNKPQFSKTFRMIPIGSLKPATHNPPTRTSMKSAKMRQTTASIDEIGLIQPITVDDDNNIIDGHRRWTCCKHLQWDEMPVIVVKGGDRNKVYAHLNSNAEIMGGLQTLQVFLKEPEAVSNRVRLILERHQEMFGRAKLRALVKAGMSYNSLSTAKRISNYTEDTSDNFLQQAIDWLIEHRENRMVKSYMTLKQPAAKLWEIVSKNKPLEIQFS